MRSLLLLLLLIGCGGGGSSAPEIQPAKVPFGWWGLGLSDNNALADNPPGELALVQGWTADEIITLAAQARSLGKKPVVMLWALMWQGKPGPIRSDWREQLAKVQAGVGDAIWYVEDEPGLNGHALADVQKLAESVQKPVYMSISRTELDTSQPIPAAVDVIGVNLYAAQGDTPQTAPKSLDALARYGKQIYLNLDGMSYRDSSGCVTSAEAQRASIALNDAILAWGKSRQIAAHIVFRWQSDGAVCGAKELPVLLPYVLALAQ